MKRLIALVALLLLPLSASAEVAVPSSTTATSSDGGGGASTSVSVGVPSGLTSGDIWLIPCALDANGSGVINTPSGFTAAHAQIDGDPGYPEVRTFWKAAGSSETSVTVSGSTGVYVLWCGSIRITGANISNPIGNVATANPSGTGSSQAAPSVTVQNAGSAVIELYACSNTNDDTVLAITLPAGMTTLGAREGSHTYPTAEIGYALRDAGAFAPGDWTTNGDVEGHVAIAIEILPATEGGATPVPVFMHHYRMMQQ